MCKGDDLITFIAPKVEKIRSLNLPEPLGPPWPVAGPPLPLPSYPITGLERPIGLEEVEASRISTQLAHEGGEVMSPPPPHTHTLSLPLSL